MADRSIHYEAAFEDYLRTRRIPYVAVDETRRTLCAEAKLKSFDYVVYRQSGPNLLVDVKGRQLRNLSAAWTCPSPQTWATEEDVNDLMQWEQVFGDGFTAVFAFIYWIDPPPVPEAAMHAFQDRWYWMLAINLADYRTHMRRRSARWRTVAVPIKSFRSLARPLHGWL